MSWSLLLSPRLSPAPLHGVSHETSEAFPGPLGLKQGLASDAEWPAAVSKLDFSEELSAAFDVLPALGVRPHTEELPITTA